MDNIVRKNYSSKFVLQLEFEISIKENSKSDSFKCVYRITNINHLIIETVWNQSVEPFTSLYPQVLRFSPGRIQRTNKRKIEISIQIQSNVSNKYRITAYITARATATISGHSTIFHAYAF